MEKHELVPHPANPAANVWRMTAELDWSDISWLQIKWRIKGAEQIKLGPEGEPERADDLWQTTCFELFLEPDLHNNEETGGPYIEINLAPSGKWNAYFFTEYRSLDPQFTIDGEPTCTAYRSNDDMIFTTSIPAIMLFGQKCNVGISAVIEEHSGAKSYWALRHADEKPDFHNRACFTAKLEPPEAP